MSPGLFRGEGHLGLQPACSLQERLVSGVRIKASSQRSLNWKIDFLRGTTLLTSQVGFIELGPQTALRSLQRRGAGERPRAAQSPHFPLASQWSPPGRLGRVWGSKKVRESTQIMKDLQGEIIGP